MPATMRLTRNATSGLAYGLRCADPAGLDDVTLHQKLMKVFADVNPAAKMLRSAAGYQEAYNRGPLLFREAVVDPRTQEVSSQLGGLQVSEGMLGPTLDKLRELGFEIDDRR